MTARALNFRNGQQLTVHAASEDLAPHITRAMAVGMLKIRYGNR